MRILIPTLIAAVAALMLAGCGGSGSGPGDAAASSQDKAFDGALKFARCMRAEGVDVPDPKSGQDGGGIVFKVGDPNAPDLDSPKYKAADEKCHPALAEVDEAVRETR